MSILCPNCRTHAVDVPSWKFSDTEVTVPLCGMCAPAYVAGATFPLSRMSEVVADLAIPEEAWGVRHATVLVTMVGAR